MITRKQMDAIGFKIAERFWEDMGVNTREQAPLEHEIRQECERIADMLCEKNRKYGNSAINPIRIFSKASAEEQLLVRIDDKVNRMLDLQSDDDEDVVLDLIGYLVLLIICRNLNKSMTDRALDVADRQKQVVKDFNKEKGFTK